MTENLIDTKPAKKAFSIIGLAMTIFLLVASVLQILWGVIPTSILGEQNWFVSSSLGKCIGTFAPIYLVGAPICIALMKKTPAENIPTLTLGGKNFWLFIPIIISVMYVGNIIGTVFSLLLSGGNAENPIANILADNNILQIIIAVIVAPIIEEFICRKQIIDRTKKYGEKTAVFFSALVFGLFHLNLYQFFYAFGLGLVFGYVYIRTGKIRYTIIYHIIVNFIGSVLSSLVLSSIDIATLSTINATTSDAEVIQIFANMMPGILIYLIYIIVLFAVVILGIVLLILQCKKLMWKPAPTNLSKGTVFKTVYINIGMILFVLLSIAGIIFSLL